VRDGKLPAVTGEEAVASLAIAIRCMEGRPATSLAPDDLALKHKVPRRVAG
jgi:hypothetical protein